MGPSENPPRPLSHACNHSKLGSQWFESTPTPPLKSMFIIFHFILVSSPKIHLFGWRRFNLCSSIYLELFFIAQINIFGIMYMYLGLSMQLLHTIWSFIYKLLG